jgi:phosphopantothenoylcysteine synthetase/decarboxylase
MNILVGITGSSSARVSHKLVRKLIEDGHSVNFIETWKNGEERPKYLKDPTVYLGCLK